MRVLKYILLIFLIIVIGGSLYIATLKPTYEIVSHQFVNAPVSVVFDEVNDYKNWKNWGPWYKTDSLIVASYPEITSGEGASYSWTSNEGNGFIKTRSILPNEEIIQQIDFGTGSTPEVFWEFQPKDNGTYVTWGIRGKNTFSEKIYWLFKGGIEKNMTPMFNKGLELLAAYLSNEMEKHSVNFKGLVDYGGGFYLYQTTSCKISLITEKKTTMLAEIKAYMTNNAIDMYGKPFILYHKWDKVLKTTMFSVCFPVNERLITTGNVLTGFLVPQKTFKTECVGDVKFLEQAWYSAYDKIKESGLIAMENGEPFEIYKIGPNETLNPSKWITEIYIPVN